MSHLAIAIDQLLQETNQTAADLSRARGITEAQISRFRSATQIWVGAGHLEAIARGLARKAATEFSKIHARLLLAHMQDECHGPGAKYIRTELLIAPITTPAEHRDAPVLVPRAQENLEILAGRISANRHIRDMVEVLANHCRSSSSQGRAE
jgi:DNA-binding Xre family transcriptional regulator